MVISKAMGAVLQSAFCPSALVGLDLQDMTPAHSIQHRRCE